MNRRILLVVAVLVAIAVALLWLRRDRTSRHHEGAAPPASAAASAPAAPRPPAPVHVAGMVSAAEDGHPIAGAVVALAPAAGSAAVDLGAADRAADALACRTDPAGQFTVPAVPPGRYSLSATAPGFVPALIAELQVPAAGLDGVAVTLTAGGHRLTGLVTDVNGGPVAGALLRVTPVHGLLSVSDVHGFAALSGDDGRYQLDLDDGRYRVTALHAEYVTSSAYVELRGGDRTLDFSLAPGAVVEGVVRDADSGEPIAGAMVTYSRESTVRLPGAGPGGPGGGPAPKPRMMTVSGRGGLAIADPQGRFRITGLPAGAISLTARSARGASAEPTVLPIGVAEQLSGVELLVEQAFSISGTVVTSDDHAPAAGVVVTALAPRAGTGIAATAATGADGRFVIEGVGPGNYQLDASSDDFVAKMLGTPVSVEDRDLTGVTVTVDRGAFVTGRVDPATVADVEIAVTAESLPGPDRMLSLTAGGATTRTLANGTFRLGPLQPGPLTLSATAADGRRGSVEVTVPPQGLDDVVIALERKASLSGRVIDADRHPVGNALVSLKRRTGNRRVTMIVNGRDATAQQSPTHEDGSFAIAGLDPGQYELSVKDALGQPLAWALAPHAPRSDDHLSPRAHPADSDQPRRPLAIELAENEQRTGVELTVETRDGVIRGLVRGPDGAPAPDVWVTATPEPIGEPMPLPPPRSDANGERHQERVEVMTMVTVAGDGDGGGGFGGGFGGSLPPVLTDRDGRFELTGLRRGRYDLMAEGLGGTARGFASGVDTGSDVTIAMVALTRIDGVVTRDGAPVSRFRIELDGPSSRSKDVRDPDGKFSLHRVDPGNYTVTAISDDGRGQAPATVTAGQVTDVSIELAVMARITGTVVGADGRPVAGAMVVLGSGGEGEVRVAMLGDEPPARTGSDGRFEVRAGPGKHLLLVMGEDSPRPLVVHPFAVAGEPEIDLGTLTAAP